MFQIRHRRFDWGPADTRPDVTVVGSETVLMVGVRGFGLAWSYQRPVHVKTDGTPSQVPVIDYVMGLRLAVMALSLAFMLTQRRAK